MTQRTRAMPKVAAAIIAAGGVVWVVQNTSPPGTTTGNQDDDRIIHVELITTSEAHMVVLANSAWRGEIANVSHSISHFDAVDISVAPGEPVDVIVIGRQDAPRRRQQIRCRIVDDEREVQNKPVVVRTGETKTVECRHST